MLDAEAPAGLWSQGPSTGAVYLPGEAPVLGAPDALDPELREEPASWLKASVMLVTMEPS